jgi:membrane protein YqaA with SNARE-associated domain
MKGWFKRLHIRSLQWAKTKWGSRALFIFTFADASFFPLPTSTFFSVLTLLNTSKVLKYILYAILGTMAGALAGYLVGYFAWLNPNGEITGIVQFLLNNIPGFSQDGYHKIQILYERWDLWILLIASFLPLPYGIFSLSAGLFDINIFIFLLVTLIGQGIRFIFLALVTRIIGTEAKKSIEHKWKPVVIISTVCLLIAIIAVRAI